MRGQLPRDMSETQRKSRPRWARGESGTGQRSLEHAQTERLHEAAAQGGDSFLDLRENGILALENAI